MLTNNNEHNKLSCIVYHRLLYSVRKRSVQEPTKQQQDEEYFLRKGWSTYILQQHKYQIEQISLALKSQEKALRELKKDNIDLYNEAIKVRFAFKSTA
jgi:hypothetical protein